MKFNTQKDIDLYNRIKTLEIIKDSFELAILDLKELINKWQLENVLIVVSGCDL